MLLLQFRPEECFNLPVHSCQHMVRRRTPAGAGDETRCTFASAFAGVLTDEEDSLDGGGCSELDQTLAVDTRGAGKAVDTRTAKGWRSV
jgi:hypothetical protein